MVTHYAEPVPHRVTWVSKQVRSPFNAVVGRKSPFGVFSHPNSMGFALDSLVHPGKISRSSFLASPVVFEDIHGNSYNWLNLKGIGLVTHYSVEEYQKFPLQKFGIGKNDAGIFDWKYARHCRDASEALLKAGVRIAPDVAHIRILKHPVYGIEGRRLKNFPRGKEPVVALRAFGCRGRLSDATNATLLKEAIGVVKKELGVRRLSKRKYAEWFVKTFAASLALMHSRGWTHGYLFQQHNVTLDARLVDLDSISGLGVNKHPSKASLYREELRDRNGAINSLLSLALAVSRRPFGRGAQSFAKNLEYLFIDTYLAEMAKLKKSSSHS